MRPSVLYRIAAVLLLLFAVAHTLGFRQVDPRWGVDSMIASMRSIHFDAQGFSRSYWDFIVGFGFFVSVFLLFSAVLAWQLGGLSQETLRLLPVITWTLAGCFVAATALMWMYFFIAPFIFSAVVAFCLILAAWLAGKKPKIAG